MNSSIKYKDDKIETVMFQIFMVFGGVYVNVGTSKMLYPKINQIEPNTQNVNSEDVSEMFLEEGTVIKLALKTIK